MQSKIIQTDEREKYPKWDFYRKTSIRDGKSERKTSIRDAKKRECKKSIQKYRSIQNQ